jgi:hypothetical protein
MIVDINAFVGSYPFRQLKGGWPLSLKQDMERVGIAEAWVGNLHAISLPDPASGNTVLYDIARRDACFRPVPAVHPGRAGWRSVLEEAVRAEAPCVRADPSRYGLDPAGSEMKELAAACGEHGVPLLLSVRLEDIRQRHPTDLAPELEPAALRALVRSDSQVKLLVTHADKDFIQQVHFGSTPDEAARILWDICWIWGPPEDHLELLLATVGVERFAFGTGMPLRLPEASIAKLDLLDLSPEDRRRLEHGNAQAFTARSPTASTHPASPARIHHPPGADTPGTPG